MSVVVMKRHKDCDYNCLFFFIFLLGCRKWTSVGASVVDQAFCYFYLLIDFLEFSRNLSCPSLIHCTLKYCGAIVSFARFPMLKLCLS